MTVGIVGGGQLGQMLALAGIPLGIDCLFLDRDAAVPAGRVAPVLCGELGDPALLRELAARSEVISFDWENVPVDAVRAAARAQSVRVAPPLRALAIAQDRWLEKRCFERLGIPTTRHAAIVTLPELQRAVRRIGLPGVLKTRRLGYDGKGQRIVRTAAEVARAWRSLSATSAGAAPVPLLYEEFVPFDLEVSIIGARSRRGEVVIYPLCRNFHRDGLLRLTLAPWPAKPLERAAQRYLKRVLEDLRYVGVLAIEFFARHGHLVANEMAPRVHNSGHWTIEGANTSQFENHLRAILGLPLGSTEATGHSAMLNLIGRLPPRARLLQAGGLHLHDYGKQARPGRKLGHVTAVARTPAARNRLARQLWQQLCASAQPLF